MLGESRLDPLQAKSRAQPHLPFGGLREVSIAQVALPWVLEGGEWRLVWDPALVLPELEGGDRLGFDRSWSGRGDIYDQDGLPLAAQVKRLDRRLARLCRP